MKEEENRKEKRDTAIVPKGQGLSITTLADAERLGEIFVNSGFFEDAKEMDQAIVKIIAGNEIGIGPMASMTGLHVFKGKVTIGANLMADAIKRHPTYNYVVVKFNDNECTINFYEGEVLVGQSNYNMQDAERAGLANRDNWRKYRKNMLFARALSNGVRWYCPDVFAGIPTYTPDEFDVPVDAQGDVIDVTPQKDKKPSKKPSEDLKEVEKKIEEKEDQAKEKEEDEEADKPSEDDLEIQIPEKLRSKIEAKELKPREALKEISDYCFDTQQLNLFQRVKKEFAPEARYVHNIKEIACVKIVEKITGVKLTKAEKTKKCSDCKKVITVPEAKEQEGKCYECFQKG